MPPNIALIVLDSARRDALEPYGADEGATPALAQLARAGCAAAHAYAPSSWTVPSHASMFTGLLPRRLGLTQAPAETPQSCRPAMEAVSDRLLPQVLRNSGYETRALSANLWLRPESGFALGFDEFVNAETGRHARMSASSALGRLRWNLEGTLARADDGAREIQGFVRRWSRETAEKPFFWFVNLVECHSPYLPPRPYSPLGPIGRWRAAVDASHYLTLGAIWRACAGGAGPSGEALERMRVLYKGAVRYLDSWVADFLEALEGAGLLDETIVIVTADHGENFGEDGLMAHAFSLDQRLIHVPFICAGPGLRVPDYAFSLSDLPQLLADACGIRSTPWGDREAPRGVAIAEFDPPAPIEDPRWQTALDEWGLDATAGERIAAPLTAATDGSLKLVRRHLDHDVAFDLVADPGEVEPRDPIEFPAPDVERLRSALDSSALRPAAEINSPEPASEEEMRRLEEQMRLLGYL